MIRATFYKQKDLITGFEISGHSGYADEGEDIICASVSSVAYMVANTLTDVIFAETDIALDEGYMKVIALDKLNETQVILKGFLLHVKNLAEDYDEFISCKETTVTE